MFFTTRYDSGPRVILAQALLRLNGFRLTISGKWDDATEMAVTALRAQMGASKANGPINGPVMAHMLQHSRIKIIDAVDASAGEVREYAEKDLRNNHHVKPVINERRVGHGVEDAMSRIRKRASGHRIGALRFCGHGNRGTWISVAVGDPVHAQWEGRWKDYDAMAADWPSYIDYAHFERMRPLLTPLRPLFASFGYVQIHSCRIGQQGELLQKLADTWNVPIMGGLTNQQVAAQYYDQYGDKVDTLLVLTGPTVTKYPGGASMRSWAARVDRDVLDIPGAFDAARTYVGKRVSSFMR